MTRWAMAGLLLLAPHAVAAGDQPKQEEGVSVELSISVQEYDPYTPSKGVVKCVLHNGGKEPTLAPVAYDGGKAVLHGGPVTLMPRKPPAKDDVKMVAVDPGKGQVVFELPLDDILLQGRDPDKPGGDWRWDWMRRPEPPRSPVHNYRKPGYVDKAEFRAEVIVGADRVVSNTVVLAVKPSKSP